MPTATTRNKLAVANKQTVTGQTARRVLHYVPKETAKREASRDNGGGP